MVKHLCSWADKVATNEVDNTTDDDEIVTIQSQWCYCKNDDSCDDMIAHDNNACAIQWFHYLYINITANQVPEGRWYCQDCR